MGNCKIKMLICPRIRLTHSWGLALVCHIMSQGPLTACRLFQRSSSDHLISPSSGGRLQKRRNLCKNQDHHGIIKPGQGSDQRFRWRHNFCHRWRYIQKFHFTATCQSVSAAGLCLACRPRHLHIFERDSVSFCMRCSSSNEHVRRVPACFTTLFGISCEMDPLRKPSISKRVLKQKCGATSLPDCSGIWLTGMLRRAILFSR